MIIEYIAHGGGGPSQLMLAYAVEGRIPARHAIMADTGSEEDCTLATGERLTMRDFFTRYVEPLAHEGGIKAYFVRSENKDGVPYPPLVQVIRNYGQGINDHGAQRLGNPAPMFGSNGGRLSQTCTDKWKIQAIRQQLRRIAGAAPGRPIARDVIAYGAQGIHYGEAWRRVKGADPEERNGWTVYKTVERPTGRNTASTWLRHYYPFVDLKMNRQAIGEELVRRGIPFLTTSECDMCPHKDLARWERTSPEKLAEIAEIEASMGGEFFFTDLRIPLLEAIAKMRERRDAQPNLFDTEPDFGCDTGICGV